MNVKQQFNSDTIAWEILFIFIAGIIGDIFIHFTSYITKGTKFQFAQGLLPYYNSLGNKLLIFNTSNWKPFYKNLSGWIQGAIWGGIACVFALLIAKLFLFVKEESDNNHK